jgi:NAD(P)-dependent dehydrogenase (short-subunit alcohol dehydrogenase family)
LNNQIYRTMSAMSKISTAPSVADVVIHQSHDVTPAANARAGRLEGEVALITGAAAGIGLATAELFAAEGAMLVLNDIDSDRLLQVQGRLAAQNCKVRSVHGDVADPGTARRAMASALKGYGKLDIVIANAGVIPLNDIVTASVQEWDRVMAVDGRGMFLTCKAAIEAMLDGGEGGAIVCVSSISGVAGQARQAVYGPAKFVASGLTKHLAVEWAAHGIRINAVAPGTIATERVRALQLEPGGSQYLQEIERMHPLGRLGLPAEVAGAILFLASRDASFITGTVLPVDGGYLAR